MNESVLSSRDVNLSENAAKRIGKLRQMENNEKLMLRLAVNGGGCSGFSYDFSLDEQKNEDDHIFSHHGAAIVIDSMSLDLVGGSEIDFVEDLVGSFFQVRNPNATATCGCGSSFSV